MWQYSEQKLRKIPNSDVYFLDFCASFETSGGADAAGILESGTVFASHAWI